MYAELHCLSNFTFLRGASQPAELVAQAAALDYRALALTDECSVAGVVRAHVAAKDCGLHLIIGAEFCLQDGPTLIALATHRAGYARLCSLITQGRRRALKGNYTLTREDVRDSLAGCVILLPVRVGTHDDEVAFCAHTFSDRLWLAATFLHDGFDHLLRARCSDLAMRFKLPVTAAGNVHMHSTQRAPLHDCLTALRLGTTVQEAGFALHANAQRYLRPRDTLATLYPSPWLAESVRIADRCQFSLDELRYEYPQELVPPELTPTQHLRALTEAGALRRWPQGAPDKARALIEHELKIIAEIRYEPYFLTVHDIVHFARSQRILCQGRGSAANSAVCYCLGITEVDPARLEMLFERFLSKERGEPPDIDVDFENARREEVIQYVYRKYGRDRAALAATVITYRRRSAVRDIGKALGLDVQQIDRVAKIAGGWDMRGIQPAHLQEAGLNANLPLLQHFLTLSNEIIGFPRHLSQHVGGFVIAAGLLCELVPVENAAMPERTIIQWDKDDLEALGLLKVDVLALGMLTAIQRTLGYIGARDKRDFTLADIPAEDPLVYTMIQRADTIGVFQIESRAQMAMLPRLRPKNFYDLVIEVSIVRPGPIQGDMVHPYLRRRNGLEAVTYPSLAIQQVLERTLGVPIFQEQVIKLAMVAAGFSAGEADQLRRAMAAWKRKGGLEPFEKKLIDGMRTRGYDEDFAHRVFEQIKGFGEYGFPESHAASFALLAYASAWLKYYEPAAFCCALINSQPMGFYTADQLLQDARRHHVTVLPVDVCHSDWDCTLTKTGELRLGLRLVKGLTHTGAQTLMQRRARAPWTTFDDLQQRAQLSKRDLQCLAEADALATLSGHRHLARWQAYGDEKPAPIFSRIPQQEELPWLPAPTEGREIADDYRHVGLTLRRHPVALLRPRLHKQRIHSAADIKHIPHGRAVRVAGLVIGRQRPGTASGVTFVTLEDETGMTNVVVWRTLAERQKRELLTAQLLIVHGVVERAGAVVHVIAGRLRDASAWLGDLVIDSRDFH
ncbi:MAG: error-prone DNA polymerase [Pseudomonadota bacterium]